MLDMTNEYLAAVERLTAADIEGLEAQGCRPEIVSGLLVDPGISLVGKVCAITHKDGTWTPSDLGQWRYVTPAIDGDDLLDLIAWRSDSPAKMYSRTGLAAALGIDAKMRAYYADAPLCVFEHALAWLQGDCRGVVVLDWRRAPLWLGDGELWCQTPALGKRLQAAYRQPLPKISFSKLEVAA